MGDMRRVWVVICAAVVGVALIVGVTVVRPWWSARQSCTAAQQNAAAAPDRVTAGQTRVAIIGDSWTSGWKLDDPTDGYAYRLAATQQWDATIDGFANSGWVNPSWCGDQRFDQRIQAIPADVDLVIIEGGLNDLESDALHAHARDTITRAKQRVPGARILVLGLPSAPTKPHASLEAADTALYAAAATAGVEYVDTSGWPLEYLPDGLHLTPAGHDDFARRVAARL